MCIQQQQVHTLHLSFPHKPKRRIRIRLLKLIARRNRRGVDTDMELKNLKLYIENMSILQENEKLRKQAHVLHQQNLVLMSQLQINRFAITPNQY